VIAVTVGDIVALAHPASGVSAHGFSPSKLFVHGVGAVFAFGVAAFIGFESGASYGEEVRDPRRTVARATYCALGFTAVFYAFSAWAMLVNVGADQLQPAATENGPGLVFGVLDQYVGSAVADIANVLFLTSILAALLSFHNGVARYFCMGREHVAKASLESECTLAAPSQAQLFSRH
jgi:amino acid transporter